MDAKSIYEELLKQGIPEKLVTWSNKADSIDILIQDYNEKVYKEALKFFKGYEGVRVDYTIDHETALWCDDVSKYSSDEFIRSITDFYYTLRAKGLAYTESKKSTRKSIKESYLDEVTNLYFFDLDVGEECEVQLKNFVMPCRISQFYKNDRYVYLIVQSKTSDETYFVITYNYKKNKFVSSKVFSSYREAKNQLVDSISMVF
jgi:hypothetical protein